MHYWRFLSTKLLFSLVSISLAGHVSLELSAQDIGRAAPDNCLFYSEWQPPAKVEADQLSATEKLLQEKEVQLFLNEFKGTVMEMIPMTMAESDKETQKAVQDLTNQLFDSAMTKSGALFLEGVGVDFRTGSFRFDGAIIMELNADKTEIQNTLATLLDDCGVPTKISKIESTDFLELELPEEIQLGGKLFFGGTKDYFIVSSGKSTTRKCLQRLNANKTPEWLVQSRKRHPVPRRFGLTYIDLGLITERYLPLAGDEVMNVFDALGLNELASLESVTGYAKNGMVTKVSLQLSGEAKGLMKLLDGKAIDPKLLDNFPADSLIAGSFGFDTKTLMKTIRGVAQSIDEQAIDEFEYALDQFQDATGVNLEEDLIDHLGPTITFANGAGDGWVMGLTSRIQVSDSKTVESSLQRLVFFIQKSLEFEGISTKFRNENYADGKIYSLRVVNAPFPLEPAWTIVDDQLVFALTRSTLRPFLAKTSPDETLSMNELTIDAVGSQKLLATLYVDERRQFEFAYPYLIFLKSMVPQLMLDMGDGSEEMSTIADRIAAVSLPSARSIYRHLSPSLINVYRTETGVDAVFQQTIPSPNVGVSAPIAIALLLPAVQAARAAARRTQSANNLKMQMLASHNFHDVYKRFPSAYSTDKDGKPLLSWRVHLLPFLGESTLYDQFKLDEPWDSEHNLKLLQKMPEVYQSPSSVAEPGKTVYRGIGGLNGSFRPPTRPGTSWGVKMAQMLDGTSNTVMIVEGNDSVAVEWTKPSVLLPKDATTETLFGIHPAGTNMAFADGSVYFVRDTITPLMLYYLFRINDGEPLPDINSELDRLDRIKQVDPESFALQIREEKKKLAEIYKLEVEIQDLRTKVINGGQQLKKAKDVRFELSQERNRLERSVALLQVKNRQKQSEETEAEIAKAKKEIEIAKLKMTKNDDQIKSIEKNIRKFNEMIRRLMQKTY